MDKGTKKQTLIPRIICLLLSFGLWLYVSNVENPLRTYEIKDIPVEILNEKAISDAGFAISNPKQFTVDLKIEGPSSEISKVKKEDFKLAADISAYALKTGENTIPVQILSYPENINIRNNGFLGVKINLEELISKQITIKSKLKISYKENIYEKEEKINPEKVTVSGAKSIVNNISQAVIRGEIKDLDKNYSNKYTIVFLDAAGNEINNVNSDIYEAELTISVDHGKSVPVKVKTTGELQKGFTLESIEQDQKDINLIGNTDILNNISEIYTEPFDISNLTESEENNLKIVLPDGITAQNNLNSIKVKFNVKEVSTEGETSKSIVCNVKYINLKEGFNIESSDPTVIIHLSGNQSELDKINSDNISAVVNLLDLSNGGSFTYTPEVSVNNPAAVKVTNVGNVTITIKASE